MVDYRSRQGLLCRGSLDHMARRRCRLPCAIRPHSARRKRPNASPKPAVRWISIQTRRPEQGNREPRDGRDTDATDCFGAPNVGERVFLEGRPRPVSVRASGHSGRGHQLRHAHHPCCGCTAGPASSGRPSGPRLKVSLSPAPTFGRGIRPSAGSRGRVKTRASRGRAQCRPSRSAQDRCSASREGFDDPGKCESAEFSYGLSLDPPFSG